MSNLVNVPKNGSLSNSNSNVSFPNWSNWIDDLFNRDLPSVFTSNFNTGMSLPKVNIKETNKIAELLENSEFLDMKTSERMDSAELITEIRNYIEKIKT